MSVIWLKDFFLSVTFVWSQRFYLSDLLAPSALSLCGYLLNVQGVFHLPLVFKEESLHTLAWFDPNHLWGPVNCNRKWIQPQCLSADEASERPFRTQLSRGCVVASSLDLPWRKVGFTLMNWYFVFVHSCYFIASHVYWFDLLLSAGTSKAPSSTCVPRHCGHRSRRLRFCICSNTLTFQNHKHVTAKTISINIYLILCIFPVYIKYVR